jgi:hypothetical protein
MGAACLGQLGAVGEGVDEGGQERLAERSAVLEHLHVCKAHPSRPVRAGLHVCAKHTRRVLSGPGGAGGACGACGAGGIASGGRAVSRDCGEWISERSTSAAASCGASASVSSAMAGPRCERGGNGLGPRCKRGRNGLGFRKQGGMPPPLPPSRTKWTRRVPNPVLTGHVSSLLGTRATSSLATFSKQGGMALRE